MTEQGRLILFVLLFGLLSSLLFAAEPILLQVNDNNLRLRAAPGLNGNIITLLQKGEILEYKKHNDLFDGDDFRWVNVKTVNGTEGWVYGEFADVLGREDFSFKFIEDAGLHINGKVILSGMKQDVLLSVLGNPQKVYYAKHDNERIDEYIYFYEDLEFIIQRHNHRIRNINIYSSKYTLANGIKVGMHISEISNLEEDISAYHTTNEKLYMFKLKTIPRSFHYETLIEYINTNSEGIIQSITIHTSDSTLLWQYEYAKGK